MTSYENLKRNKCLPYADARDGWTGVGNTENPRQRSKIPFLAAKMLKKRKKSPGVALLRPRSGKFAPQKLDIF